MALSKKALITGLLFTSLSFSSVGCAKKPDFVNLSQSGHVDVDYVRTTNFAYEDRKQLSGNLYLNVLGSKSPHALRFGQKYGSNEELVLKNEYAGRWCNNNKCFILRSRGVEVSDKLDSSDATPSAFIIPESQDNGRKWNFYAFLDSSWGEVRSPFKWVNIGNGVKYGKLSTDDYSKLDLRIVEKVKEGELPKYISLDHFDRIDLYEEVISRKRYKEIQKNPESKSSH